MEPISEPTFLTLADATVRTIPELLSMRVAKTPSSIAYTDAREAVSWREFGDRVDALAMGKAELKRAEWNRQILIQEAKAKEEAAVSWANAEITRAGGAAQANKILGEYLGGPEAYLRWLFIEQLPEIKGQIIYLPTEAGIPILEAGRR